jgi:hypothetical protein
VSRELTEADGPTADLVDFDKVAAALPYYEQNKISERRLARANRRAPGRKLDTGWWGR